MLYMVRSQSFEKILEIKKKKFIEVVHKICKRRDLPIPYINFDGCPDEDENQLAHYHSGTNTICVSESQLIKIIDVEGVAVHEVTHILVSGHGPDFGNQEAINSITSFNPPAGTVFIDGGRKTEKETFKEPKKSKIDKIRCNYHLCKKKRKLTKCKYCGGYYCKEHIKPYKPYLFGQKSNPKHKTGHPCIPYAQYLTKKDKEEKEKYHTVLGNLLKKEKKPIYNEEPIYPIIRSTPKLKEPEKEIEEQEPIKTPKINPKTLKYLTLIILLLLVVLIYAIFSSITEEIVENVNKTKIVMINKTIPSQISFSEFLENISYYDKKSVTLKGFLRRYIQGNKMSGVYMGSIVDDNGNNIDLTGLNKDQKELFPHEGITQELYQVKGVFRKKYNKLGLEVHEISQTERDLSGTKEVEKVVSYSEDIIKNITKPRYPIVRNFVFNLLNIK